MTPMPPADLPALRALSARIGADPLLIQAAGGNTSVKEGDVMWIKASGTLLAEAETRDILVPVDLAAMRAALAADDPTADQPANFLLTPGALRPSIETSLHAVFPQRVVVHVHCVQTIALAIREDAPAALAPRLEGLAWAFAPYVKPGATLAAEVAAATARGANVVVLGNHGLIVAADTTHDATSLLDAVTARLRADPGPDRAHDAAPLAATAAGSGYAPAAEPAAHHLAFAPESIARAAAGSLYPDHVIFCGIGAAAVAPGETVAQALAGSPTPPVVLIVPGQGVLLPETRSAGTEALARCLSDVLRRVPPGVPLRYLTLEENAALLNWDAEKYRQALNAG